MNRALSRRDFVGGLACQMLALEGCRRSQTAAASRFGRWDALVAYLERAIPSRLQAAPRTPGVAIALVADGKLLWSRGFGVKDRTSNQAIDGDTIFEFASLSKPVFAYVVMKACENGVLNLDTPLTTYTPDRFLEGDPRLDLITARHVLSHQSGFQNWRSKTESLKIQFTPGTSWDYSGEGYSYLQSVLTHLVGHVDVHTCKTYDDGRRVCATDFEDYMNTHVFAPFGMRSSGYAYQDGMARPYDENGAVLPSDKPTSADVARYGSSAALHSTVNDFAKFLIEVIDPKPPDTFRLNAASLREMLRPQRKLTAVLSWGLGWAIEQHPDMGDIISHSGDNNGFKSMAAGSMRRRAACVLAVNGDKGFEDVIVPVLRSAPMRDFLPITI